MHLSVSFMFYRHSCNHICSKSQTGPMMGVLLGMCIYCVSAVWWDLSPFNASCAACWQSACAQLGLLSDAVVSMKPLCLCGCWCFSCSSRDSGHTGAEAGKGKQLPAIAQSRGAAMRCSTLLAILTGVLLYLVLGAVVFRALETPREENKHMQLQDN